MKKIILAFVTIITMMLCIASPLFIKPIKSYASGSVGVTGEQDASIFYLPVDNLLNYYGNDCLYIYWTIYQSAGPYYHTYFLPFDDYETLETDTNGNAVKIVKPKLNGNDSPIYHRTVYSFNNYSRVDSIYESTVDTSGNFWSISSDYNSSNGKWSNSGTHGSLDMRLEPVAQPLNVLVDFSPDLIGNVDRQITAIDGTNSMRKDLAMQVVNQSNFPIQYDMRIYKVNQSSSRDWSLNPETFATQFDSDSVSYDDDPVFIYYKNEWVYTTNYDSESTFWDLEPVKENKGASWHYLAANSQDIVTFNFTQINLDENVDYYVEVRAVRNDYGCSSEKIVYSASDNLAESEYKQIQGDDIEIVYHEQFKMINYSDVVYNPNEESNGVLPYNGKNGIVSRNTYQYGRNARDNGNGNIDYTARNLYTDQNSWYNQQYHRVVSNHTSSASSGSVPSNITNLFDSFMKFVSYVFLRFPANMQTIYVYGFVSIVVLGIVLKVIK